jgi:hypothetical protein
MDSAATIVARESQETAMDHDFAVRLERRLAEEKAARDDHKKAVDTGNI